MRLHSPTKTIRKHIKVIAAFFIVNFLSSLFAPNIAYALTSGPTAPESFSFEPVDMTDVVNLQTGDFVYGVPLMEVPGPGGGFPINLSYHAGIQNDLDASWVGLGWTLNPGAISRYVNGMPDDHRGKTNTQRDFWSGGETTYNSYGVSFGVGDFASVSANVITANDSYRGTGLGYSLGGSIGDQFSPIGLAGSVGKSPFGGYNASIGIVGSKGFGALGVNGFAGINYSEGQGLSAGFSGGISVGYSNKNGKRVSASLLGASISTAGGGVGVSVAGASTSQHNSQSGKISTSSSSSGITIPIPVVPGLSVSHKRTYVRYWSDETEGVTINGALYNEKPSSNNYENRSYDTYEIEDRKSFSGLYAIKFAGGSGTLSNGLQLAAVEMEDRLKKSPDNATLLDYDSYNVNAQGLAGGIKPYYYQSYLNRRTLKRHEDGSDVYDLKNIQMPGAGDQLRPHFRFVGDFGNKLIQGEHFAQASMSSSNPIFIQFNGEMNSFELKVNSSSNYRQEVTGSKNVKPIYGGNNLLTGFEVTNETGVVYEFKQPVYASTEHVYSENIDKRKGLENDQPVGGHAFNHLKKPDKYAYSWLLTAMKGPDYVDRGDAGLSSDDWGYWIEFDYGKWTNDYGWRTPDSGFTKDIDNNFQSFSQGYKELYYLDAIKTATHTALFTKSIRKDGHGVALEKNLVKVQNNNYDVIIDDGGYDPKEKAVLVGEANCSPSGLNVDLPVYGYSYPTSTLKLDNIMLFKNEDLEPLDIQKNRSNYFSTFTITGISGCTPGSFTQQVHTSNSVWDEMDAADYPSLQDLAIRTIVLKTDYSLSKGTSNSFSNDNLYKKDPVLSSSRNGKLTLKELVFKGKGGIKRMPSQKFKYDVDYPTYSTSVRNSRGTANGASKLYLRNWEGLENGDLVKVSYEGGKVFCHAKGIRIISGISYMLVETINETLFQPGLATVQYSKTKNPGYSRTHKDIWGFFKADFENTEKNNLDKMTTEVSGRNVDVWSLRGITSPLGAKTIIEYESDTYGESVFTKSYPFILDDEDLYDNDSKFITGTLNYPGSRPSEGSVKIYYKEYPKTTCAQYVTEGSTTTCVRYNHDFNNPIIRYAELNDVTFSGSGNNISFQFLPNKANTHNLIEVTYVNIHFLQQPFYGGGLRVKSIESHDPVTKVSNKINYEYFDVDRIGDFSSGVTSYEPIITDPVFQDLSEEEKKIYAHESGNDLLGNVMNYSRFMPGPGVFYKNVTVSAETFRDQEQIGHSQGRTEYEFHTYKRSMLKYRKYGYDSDNQGTSTYQGTEFTAAQTRKLEIKNLSSLVGAMKSVSYYDADDNILSKSETGYLHDDSGLIENKFEGQGIIEEVFVNGRFTKTNNDDWKAVGVVSSAMEYPSIQVGERHYNYKTGIETVSYNVAFDHLSGQLTESVTSDGYGNHYLNRTIPAFRVSAYASMKDDNLLGQQAGNETWLIGAPSVEGSTDVEQFLMLNREPFVKLGLVGASATTWKKFGNTIDGVVTEIQGQSGIWRQRGQYAWVGDESKDKNEDGTDKPINYQFFNYASESSNGPNWQRNSLITKYDVNSHALEVKDINGNFAATKFDSQNERVFATVANAKYDEFAFSGAEDETVEDGGIHYFGGRVQKGGTVVEKTESNSIPVHTGKRSIKITGTGQAFRYWVPQSAAGKIYRTSVWANHADAQIRYKVDGGTVKVTRTNENKKAGDWYLIEAEIPVPSSFTDLEVFTRRGSSTATIYWDDFRIHPIDATMTSYAYNEWGELSDILDANNLFTHYDYDAMGRLKSVTRETFSDGPVKISNTSIYYSKNGTDQSLYGRIQSSSNNNVVNLSVDFTNTGSDNLTYKWKVGSSSHTTNKSTYGYVVNSSNSGYKDVIVEVIDNANGTSFTAFDRIFFRYCTPAGQWLGNAYCEMDYVETNEGQTLCYTGRLVRNKSNGNCLTPTVVVIDSNSPQCLDNCSEECPPGQICEIEQQ